MICAQLSHTFCKYRVYFRKSKSFRLRSSLCTYLYTVMPAHQTVLPPCTVMPDLIGHLLPFVIRRLRPANLVFVQNFPAKPARSPRKQGDLPDKPAFFCPVLPAEPVGLQPSKQKMLARLHPTVFSASSTRGSRSQRTAPAHPPTARANERRPPHILPTGCRNPSSSTGVHEIAILRIFSGHLSVYLAF